MAQAAAAAVLLLGDLGLGLELGQGPWPLVLVSGLTASVMAVLRPVDLETRVSITIAVSLVVTCLVFVSGGHSAPGFAEVASMALLLILAVRFCRTRQAMALAGLLGLSMVMLGFRTGYVIPGAGVGMAFGLVAGAAIGVGAYLRSVDDRRSRAMSRARQAERLELARDLHDFVAHHITGIVVQTQAARYVAKTSPEQTAKMLGEIEGSAAQALASMRRLVSVLRADPEAGVGTRPSGSGLTQVHELMGGFAGGEPPARLEIDPVLAQRVLPPEIATTVHRVVQESLTNARKYAADATLVRVSIKERGGGIEVAVRDDGRGTRRRIMPGGASGGYGIVGLTERVTTVGGHLHAGPRPEGGWEVVAWFGP